MLGESGVVRSDITTSFGGMTGTATGAPLTVRLKVLDVADGCTPMPGAAVYAWHCDADGRYSLYSHGVTDQNYLRGVQAADADGWVTFHRSSRAATTAAGPTCTSRSTRASTRRLQRHNAIETSQLALPQDVCEKVYADTVALPVERRQPARLSLTTDNVFRDGWQSQLATVTGDAPAGYVAQMNVGV